MKARFGRATRGSRVAVVLWATGVLVGAASSEATADAISLATGLNAPSRITVNGVEGSGSGNEASGDYVYFGQLTQSPCYGELDELSVASGPVTPVAKKTAFSDTGSCRGIGSQIWFTQNTIVFGYGGFEYYAIGTAAVPCAKESCNPNTLVSEFPGGNLIGAASGNAYFMYDFSSIKTVPISGGAPTVISGADSYFVESNVLDWHDGNPANNDIDSTSGAIYFVNYYNNNVYRLNLPNGSACGDGSCPIVLRGNSDEGQILTDIGNVFWTDGTSVEMAPKGGTCTPSSCTIWSGESGSISSWTVDEQEVDNSAGSIFFSNGTQLYRLAKQIGATPTALLSGTNTGVTVVQTDGARVYYTANSNLYSRPASAMGDGTTVDYASLVAPLTTSTLDDGLFWVDTSGALSYVVQDVSQLDQLQYSSDSVFNSRLNGIYQCACLSAVYSVVARMVLRAEGQYGAASGISIDDFFESDGQKNPCTNSKAKGANWEGNGDNWQNPVYSTVNDGNGSNSFADFRGTTDLYKLLETGPVTLKTWVECSNCPDCGSNCVENHYILAIDSWDESDVIAYDPLSGTKVWLQGGAGSYSVSYVLDPVSGTWCSQNSCNHLLRDIKSLVSNFDSGSLSTVWDLCFAAGNEGCNGEGIDRYQTWTMTP